MPPPALRAALARRAALSPLTLFVVSVERRGFRFWRSWDPGDYVFVPAFAPHQEENPPPDEAVVILARATQEAIVVSLPGLVP